MAEKTVHDNSLVDSLYRNSLSNTTSETLPTLMDIVEANSQLQPNLPPDQQNDQSGIY